MRPLDSRLECDVLQISFQVRSILMSDQTRSRTETFRYKYDRFRDINYCKFDTSQANKQFRQVSHQPAQQVVRQSSLLYETLTT